MDALWLAMRPAMISPQLPTVGAGSSRFSRRFPRPPSHPPCAHTPPPPTCAVTDALRTGGKNGPHVPWAQARGLFPIPTPPVALPLRRGGGDAPAPPRSINQSQ